ncbi:hypothetical protein [Kribbella sp. NPDC050459]|uniref:hypothetical protein n=1 Tax=Kribbella sp. NPDC050459 TaxID=3155785 RepID=UPI0033E1AE3B
MSDYVFGNKAGRDQIIQGGEHNTLNVSRGGVSQDDVDTAVAELRAFVAELTRAGIVSPDGSVTDPGAVVAAVQSHPRRLKALTTALAAGAKDTVLAAVKSGVATLIVALLGHP